MLIPIPSGLTLPDDAEATPFDLSGQFIVSDGMLMPLMLGGQKIPMDGEGEEPEMEEPEMEEDMGMGMGGGGFMAAVETAMRPKK